MNLTRLAVFVTILYFFIVPASSQFFRFEPGRGCAGEIPIKKTLEGASVGFEPCTLIEYDMHEQGESQIMFLYENW